MTLMDGMPFVVGFHPRGGLDAIRSGDGGDAGSDLAWRMSYPSSWIDSVGIEVGGGATVSAHQDTGRDIDASILWIDETGAIQDERVLGALGSYDFLKDHVVAPSKVLYAVGHKTLTRPDFWISNEAWLLAIDEEHEVLWERTLNFGLLREGLQAVAMAANGDLVTAGYSVVDSPSGSFQAMVYRLDPESGELSWRTTLMPGTSSVAMKVATAKGRVIVGGHVFDDSDTERPTDAWVAAVSDSGEPLWQFRMDYEKYEWIDQMIVTSEGVIVLAIGSRLIALNTDGRVLWEQAFPDVIQALASGPEGSLWVVSCE
jgi:outer membrane protein assembly factor BamB